MVMKLRRARKSIVIIAGDPHRLDYQWETMEKQFLAFLCSNQFSCLEITVFTKLQQFTLACNERKNCVHVFFLFYERGQYVRTREM
jgi:hypothetical protein